MSLPQALSEIHGLDMSMFQNGVEKEFTNYKIKSVLILWN